MPTTLQEQLDANKSRLDALLAPATTEEQGDKLPAADILAAITDELKKGNVSKERGEYLQTVLADLAKMHFEATTFIPLKVLNDPLQTNPQTISIGTMQSLIAASPTSQFSSNASMSMKAAQLCQKLLSNPELIAKGQYSDKLEDLMDFFGIKKDDLKEEYDLRWKVGDMISALQQAVKLEQMVSKAAKEEQAKGAASGEVEKSADKRGHLPVCGWPSDMASAKYDPVAKSYERKELPFGTDSETR